MTALSPEEKQRIYLEEKERLGAQEKIKKEKQAKQTKGCLIGCLIPIVVIVVIFIIIIILGTCESRNKNRSYTSTNDRILNDYHRKGEFLG
jgi:hypothetical protein